MPNPPTLALAMIVRNAADELTACLGSVRGVVDEIVVGDTGSDDRSPEIAASLGARVVSIPWTNHFADARNRVLDAVTSDWVLVLDADERLDPVTRVRVRDHLNGSWDGYQVSIRNYVDRLDARLWDRNAIPNDGLLAESNRFPAWLGHQNVRLFRRQDEIRFTGRVHESVGPKLEQHGLRLGEAEFLIHHLGFVMTPEAERQKHEFYRQLGKLKLQESPGNAQAHFEVGLEELTRGSGAGEALGYFVQACRIDPQFALAWLFGGVALSLLGHFDQAAEFVHQAEALGYRSALLVDLRSDLLFRKGNYVAAAEGYRQLLAGSEPAPEAESKLGMALWRAGRVAEGLAHMRRGIDSYPAVPANYDRLTATLVAQNEIGGAVDVARAKLNATAPQPENFLRLASLCAQLSQWSDVREALQAGCLAFPDDRALRMAAEENGAVVPDINDAETSSRKN